MGIRRCDDEGGEHAGKPHVCLPESQENESQTILSLQDKLREANALIDKLVEGLEHISSSWTQEKQDRLIKSSVEDWLIEWRGIIGIANVTLAEAKKWKGEV